MVSWILLSAVMRSPPALVGTLRSVTVKLRLSRPSNEPSGIPVHDGSSIQFNVFIYRALHSCVTFSPPPPSEGSCEKIGNFWKARREGAPPPTGPNELRARWRPGAPAERIFSQLQGE